MGIGHLRSDNVGRTIDATPSCRGRPIPRRFNLMQHDLHNRGQHTHVRVRLDRLHVELPEDIDSFERSELDRHELRARIKKHHRSPSRYTGDLQRACSSLRRVKQPCVMPEVPYSGCLGQAATVFAHSSA